MRRTVGITAGIAAAAVLGAFALSCGDSTAPAPKTWVANLNTGAEANSAITTGASGTVTFVDHGTSIDWTMTLNNTTNVTLSHIHKGTAANVGTTAGPVIINLFLPNRPPETGTLNGFVQGGQITNANNSTVSLDSLRVLLNNGNAYANVHTVAFPAGEIRDQIHAIN